MQADNQMDEKIYNKIWRDYCLSDWFITDLMSCRNGGSYIEALNALIYNRQLVVKNTPVNTLSEGNQVSTLRQLVVKNENRDFNTNCTYLTKSFVFEKFVIIHMQAN